MKKVTEVAGKVGTQMRDRMTEEKKGEDRRPTRVLPLVLPPQWAN
jgi:hypothetical protein